MKKAKVQAIVVVVITWGLFAAGSAWGVSLPAGLIMREGFRPGIGAPVGSVLEVQGEVVIVHAEQKEGYWARKDLPLFKGDVVATRPKGRVRLQLVDESKLTLGSETKIELSESVYNRRKKSRFSFIRMSLGKARFLVQKLVNLRRSSFKVRTSTAVIGVRGTEFIVVDLPGRTDVISIKDPIEVTSLAKPEEVVVVEEQQKTIVYEGELPSDPVPVDPVEIETLSRELVIVEAPAESGTPTAPAGTGAPGGVATRTDTIGETTTGEPAAGGAVTTGPGTAGVAETQTTVESAEPATEPQAPTVATQTEPTPASPGAVSGTEPAPSTPIAPLGVTAVLVPEGALVEPTDYDVELFEEPITPEIVQEIVQTEQVSEIQQQEDIIKEVVQETLGELPEFPLLPTP